MPATFTAALPLERRSTPVPRLSVVIPTYNRAHYIRQAIDSVLRQTMQDVEIIVVDDGSTDNTRAQLASYGDRIRYIRTENKGVAHARDVGSAASRGQYITFLDSDDLLYPYMLELESRLLDRCPDVGLVYAEMSGFDDHGFFDRFHLKTYHHSAYRDPRVSYGRMFDTQVTLGDLEVLPADLVSEDRSLVDRRAYFGNIFDSYLLNIVVFQNNTMLRRDVVEAVGARNARMKYYEELEYLLRITRAHRVCFVDVPTYKLRYHDGQVSSTAGPGGRYVWLRKQQELLRIVKRNALAEPSYYEHHRGAVDRHLAHLHRAVAVPLLLADGTPVRRRAYARHARKYLARCARYGHPHRGLWLMTFAPGAVRRFGVSLVEQARALAHRWSGGRTVREA
jgi:glycosyltransferase involved in cell wall biosynthesis